MKHNFFCHQHGYTLIELVVVIALSAILLIVLTTFFFATILGGTKSANIQEVKEAGQYAMNQITYLIRNAKSIDPNQVCDGSNQSTFTIINQDLNSTEFSSISSGGNTRLASNSGTYLTPSDIAVHSGPTFVCTDPGNGSPISVTIQFSLQKGNSATDQPRDIVNIAFQSSAQIRSY